MKILFGITLLLLFSSPAFPCEILKGKVIGVKDGDTIVIKKEQKQIVIRLAGIDTPEKGQPFAKRAKAFTSDIVFGKSVKVMVEGTDPHKRKTGQVFIKGTNLNEALVAAGLAWVDPRFSKSLGLTALQREAQRDRRGLWTEDHPMPPWEFRKQRSKSKKNKSMMNFPGEIKKQAPFD